MVKINKKIFLMLTLLLMGIFLINLAFAATEVSYCCEKTKSGAWCQNSPQTECDPGFRSTPASCEATSFCKKGFCYDSQEGTCDENTPEKTCEISGGVWQEDKGETPKQCQLGCCLIGDQAAFVTQVSCKKLSSVYGLKADFRSNVNDEFSCIALAQTSEEGACVLDDGVEKSCKRTTKADCDKLKGAGGGNGTAVTFHNGFLCTAEELGTDCAATEKTTCVPNKDEVYFVDTCGNIANIYDASKIKDKNYWKDIKSKEEVCNPNSANANSKSCGNCNYLGGSICQSYKVGLDKTAPQYGDYICRDLSCSFKGQTYQHGETWCADTDSNQIGSTYYRYICFNGEVTVDACDQFRNKVCIQDEVNGFKSAACRENKWQDCYSQKDKQACENQDARDCKWIVSQTPLTLDESGGFFSKVSSGAKNVVGEINKVNPLADDSNNNKKSDKGVGACVPQNPPGLAFWQPGDAQQICSLGNAKCLVTYETTSLGKKQCVKNCECLTDAWAQSMNNVCISLGDCGDKTNWVGSEGYTKGYKIGKKKVKDASSSGSSSSGSTAPAAPASATAAPATQFPATNTQGRIQGATGGIISVGEEWTNNITQ